MNDYNQAFAFVAAIAGDPNVAIVDFRSIHDSDKARAAIPFRGTLPECWSSICHYNSQGYGCFMVIAALDGVGRHLVNVSYLRGNYVDMDSISALQNYERALTMQPPPSLGVQSSPGKFHVYWPTMPYVGNDRFELIQRKLRQLFDGDKAVIDATRVMRLPGTVNHKYSDPASDKYTGAAPHLVTFWTLPGFDHYPPVETLETALAGVNVIDGGAGERHDLGEPTLAAPSLAWLQHALDLTDPNDLERDDWIALTSAIKQAGWSLTDEATLRGMWEQWCSRYNQGVGNDLGENDKQWNSIRQTQLGWHSLLRRVPSLQAAYSFQGVDRTDQLPATPPAPGDVPAAPVPGEAPPMPEPAPLDCSGEWLTHIEQMEWFKGCMYVETLGAMLTPKGRLLNVTQFNASYGGKKFIVDTTGKTTNEAWAAATRSTLWTVPKVDHMRFLPHAGFHDILTDELGRDGVNTYRPIIPDRMVGDPSPFLNHIAALLPDPGDQRILFDYLAHNVKYPGHKIPWAPVIQSAEGAGKGVMKFLVTHMMGRPYVYFPNAQELTKSGAQFNAWMRNKTFILVDEVKVDERRELIEILKPMISEEIIEIQGKGTNQELEDNFSNWFFFTNYKDAIPVNKNGRRYAIFYTPIQTEHDLIARGMDGVYFAWLYNWMRGLGNHPNGSAIVTDWLLNYPIECGAIPMRAPRTSTADEAVSLSRSPVERAIADAIEDQIPGFKGGWISSLAAINRVKAVGAVRTGINAQVIKSVVEAMGYVYCGRADQPFFQEDKDQRADLYYIGRPADVRAYGDAQGWIAG